MRRKAPAWLLIVPYLGQIIGVPMLRAVQKAHRWIAEQLYLTTREVEVLDIGYKIDALAKSKNNRGQLGLQTILAAVTIVIAVSLSVIIVDKFDQSLGTPSSNSLSQAQSDVLGGFADMTSLIGPLLLVAVSTVIIGLIRRVAG